MILPGPDTRQLGWSNAEVIIGETLQIIRSMTSAAGAIRAHDDFPWSPA